MSHDIWKLLLNSEQNVRCRRLRQPRFSTPICAADPARVVRVMGVTAGAQEPQVAMGDYPKVFMGTLVDALDGYQGVVEQVLAQEGIRAGFERLVLELVYRGLRRGGKRRQHRPRKQADSSIARTWV